MRQGIPLLAHIYHFHTGDGPFVSGGRRRGAQPQGAEGEDLPYKVELWDPVKQAVEQVLAVTANSSIGYAAYYAATREYADRYVTLRHKGSILIRWNAPTH